MVYDKKSHLINLFDSALFLGEDIGLLSSDEVKKLSKYITKRISDNYKVLKK